MRASICLACPAAFCVARLPKKPSWRIYRRHRLCRLFVISHMQRIVVSCGDIVSYAANLDLAGPDRHPIVFPVRCVLHRDNRCNCPHRFLWCALSDPIQEWM